MAYATLQLILALLIALIVLYSNYIMKTNKKEEQKYRLWNKFQSTYSGIDLNEYDQCLMKQTFKNTLKNTNILCDKMYQFKKQNPKSVRFDI